MRLGLHCLGIGNGARPEIIRAVAEEAEELGWSTLWVGEHLVRAEGPDRRYPYSPSGTITLPPEVDWLDPWTTLTLAAVATREIVLATGIILLAQHEPLGTAKQVASLDLVSGGRVRLGIGIGWSEAEFRALGVPFADRAARTEEYLAVLRAIWSSDPTSFAGDFVRFEGVRSFPKPPRGRIPVYIGGNSGAALDRVARIGDGWYGFNLSAGEVPELVGVLAERCRAHGREPAEVEVAVSLAEGEALDPELLEGAGVDELVVVSSPPPRPELVRAWLEELWAGAGGRS